MSLNHTFCWTNLSFDLQSVFTLLCYFVQHQQKILIIHGYLWRERRQLCNIQINDCELQSTASGCHCMLFSVEMKISLTLQKANIYVKVTLYSNKKHWSQKLLWLSMDEYFAYALWGQYQGYPYDDNTWPSLFSKKWKCDTNITG